MRRQHYSNRRRWGFSSIETTTLIEGFGINDADYVVSPGGVGNQVPCVYYTTWRSMVTRCYSLKLHNRYPHYAKCVVCDEWRSFIAFRSWMMLQDWEEKEIDKDLIGDGRLYSSETCCFVPQGLNLILTDSKRARGAYPIGVCKDGTRFKAYLKINGRLKHLGRFDTPEEAACVYRSAKYNHVKQKLEDYPDERVKSAALRKLGG